MIKLNTLTNRQQMILLLLVSADSPQTSMAIASHLSVSSRTIKTEMIRISEVLHNNGAELVAKRNQGYSIHIENDQRFGTMKEYLRSKTAHINLANSREGDLFLYLTRRLISTDGYTSVDELCREFYISSSTLHALLKHVYPFFESFHLKIISNSKGIQISGSEQMIRLAMSELVELHPSSSDRQNQDMRFERWVGCEYAERQDIRHSFLKILRNSGYSVRDSVAHRMAMYLIIARNRIRSSYRIVKLKSKADIQKTGLYALAESIIDELGSQYEDFDFDDNEISFLGMYIISNLDLTLYQSIDSIAPFLNASVQQTCDSLLGSIHSFIIGNVCNTQDMEAMLKQILFPIAAGKHFDLDGYEHYDFSSDKTYQKDPLCMFFAAMASHAIKESMHCRMSLSDISILSCCFLSQLMKVQFPIQKLRILTTHSIAGQFAYIQTSDLNKYFSALIESITPVELYEIRGLPEEYYDAVVTENVVPGKKNQGLFGYNYSYPASQIRMTGKGKDFRTIYNTLLTHAYQTDGLVPSADSLHFFDDFEYFSKKQVYQLFSERYADGTNRKELYQFFCEQNSNDYAAVNGTMFVFGCARLCKEPYFDLYSLPKHCRWDGVQIDRLFFISMKEDITMQELKAMETILDIFAKDSHAVDAYKNNPIQEMQVILNDSLKME